MQNIAISAKNVSKKFGNHLALDNVSFELKKGEIHCLAGENGSGKSTLIKILNGVYSVEPGAVFEYDGSEKIYRISPPEAKRLGVHVIWQDLALFEDLTVAENIVFDEFVSNPFKLINRQKACDEAQKTVDTLKVDIDVSAKLSELNIAKRQLVAICRVLHADARVVIMDEPTASLTKKETDNLLAIVHKLSASGISVVFVSHRLAEVLDVSERVTILRDGKLVGCFSTDGMTQRKLSKYMTGQDLESTPRTNSRFGRRVIETKHLSVKNEFEDISFYLRKGEILGIAGLMGSGRTELALSLFGMTRPDNGRIYIDGRAVNFSNNRDAINAGIAYVSEDRLNLGLVQEQSIIKNTAITILEDISGPFSFLSPRKMTMLCQSWINKLKTRVSDATLAVSTLSGGNQQRVVLAKWMATKPKVLVLDSPTVGVDVGAKAGIFQTIEDLAAQGMAFILISDEASELYNHSDRILIMKSGKAVHEFKAIETSENELEAIIESSEDQLVGVNYA